MKYVYALAKCIVRETLQVLNKYSIHRVSVHSSDGYLLCYTMYRAHPL